MNINLSNYYNNTVVSIAILLSIVIGYIYFANFIIYQIIGVFVPLYFGYQIISVKNNIKQLRALIKYFIIYGHIEFLFIFLNLYHIRILMVTLLVTSFKYDIEIISEVYNKLISYDKRIISFLQIFINKISQEFKGIQ